MELTGEQYQSKIKKELWKIRAKRQAEELSSAFYSRNFTVVKAMSVDGRELGDAYAPGRSGITDWGVVASLEQQEKALTDELFLLQHPEVVEERKRFAELERLSVERAQKRVAESQT